MGDSKFCLCLGKAGAEARVINAAQLSKLITPALGKENGGNLHAFAVPLCTSPLEPPRPAYLALLALESPAHTTYTRMSL